MYNILDVCEFKDEVFYIVDNDIVIIIFNVLECMNIILGLMFDCLIEFLVEVDEDKNVCVIVLMGMGWVFCVGFNL